MKRTFSLTLIAGIAWAMKKLMRWDYIPPAETTTHPRKP